MSMAEGKGKENPMREILIEKVTVNMGIGQPGEGLDNAKELLGRLAGKEVVLTRAKRRNPTFKLREGMEIGVKTTLRGEMAREFLLKALQAKKNLLSARNFDKNGNFAFGIAEYIDFPGAKYDPKIGMLGFDVCVTLGRRGYSVAKRRLGKSRVGKGHMITKEEGIGFAKGLGAKVE